MDPALAPGRGRALLEAQRALVQGAVDGLDALGANVLETVLDAGNDVRDEVVNAAAVLDGATYALGDFHLSLVQGLAHYC